MTREEEIREAIDKTFPCTNGGRCYEQSIGASGFELGVHWADNNPKSPWISVDEDLPINHKELLSKGSSSTKRVIVIEDGGYHIDCMALSKDGEWDWFYSINPSHWFPVPDLPKE